MLDDWTDTWLCSALIKDARKCSCEQISWNDFGSYNAELLAAKMCELFDKPITACYIGICSFPQDRWAGMGDKSHCHRWDFMSVVAFSDKAHLQMLEKHCVSAVRRFADGSGKPIANILLAANRSWPRSASFIFVIAHCDFQSCVCRVFVQSANTFWRPMQLLDMQPTVTH